MMNCKETPPSNSKMRSVVHFLTIENNSGAEIHCCLCTVYGEENVMNLKKWLAMTVDVSKRENKHTWWQVQHLTKLCDVYTLFSKIIVYYWHVMIDGSTLLIRSLWGSNSSYISSKCEKFAHAWFLDSSPKYIQKITWERNSTSLCCMRTMGITYTSE